ncbi:MAG: right-handed parallel beta-helix repeat-containing protein, partial [Lachnospiraceae bacterium]|nr:right-handed parallel beta-helix repeat-containing protein [Lachnospiraceae bacterium]
MKKHFSLFLSVLIVFSLIISNFDGGLFTVQHVSAEEVFEVSSWDALIHVVNYFQSAKVVLTDDIEGPKTEDSIIINKLQDITIDLNGHKINRNKVEDGTNYNYSILPNAAPAFDVYGKCTIMDSTYKQSDDEIDECGMITNANKSGVFVHETGTLVLESGLIGGSGQGNFGNRARFAGGGVYVDGGKFIMNGGKIFGNNVESTVLGLACGGGVYLTNNAEFTMNGGLIGRNHALRGGGIFANESNITVNGGYIGFFGNEASGKNNNGSGGVYLQASKFEMNGGNIDVNQQGGVYVDASSEFILNNGSLSNNFGPGITVDGKCVINDGLLNKNFSGIHVNSTGSCYFEGGEISGSNENGVVVSGSTSSDSGSVTPALFLMTGGNITNNIGYNNGGGVCIEDNASFVMEGGSISKNYTYDDSTSDHCGAGVYIGDGASFRMRKGDISENNCASGYGSGVYISDNARFYMYGGQIVNNISSSKGTGAGVYAGENSLISLSGTSVIKDNYKSDSNKTQENLYLPRTGSSNLIAKIKMYSRLDQGATIGVTVGNYDNEDYRIITMKYSTTNGHESPSKYFRSDNTDYHVGLTDNNEVILKDCNGVMVKNEGFEPTCTTEGRKTYWSCSECGCMFSDEEGTVYTDEDEVKIPALGHDWGETTYTWSEDYSTVTAKRVCKRDSSHVEEMTVETMTEVTHAATCTSEGRKVYIAVFPNSEFETQTKTVAIPMTSHIKGNFVKENVVEATCTTGGSCDMVQYCLRCNKELSRTHIETDPLGHDWTEWVKVGSVEKRYCLRCGAEEERDIQNPSCNHGPFIKVEAVDPTCISYGMKEYYKCSQCGEVYPSINGERGDTPLTEEEFEDLRIDKDPINGHQWNHVVSENIVAATCENEGSYDEVIYCSLCGAEKSREKKTMPALGHNWDTPTYEWSEDLSQVTAERVCLNDSTHIETETVDTVKTETAPTCGEEGKTTYTATFTNEGFETQTKEIPIDKLEHEWDDPVYVWADDNSSVTA